MSPQQPRVSPSRRRKIFLHLDTEGTVYFVDESGSKGTAGRYFVTAAVKTVDPDRLSRAVQAVREKRRFTERDELKFNDVTKRSMPILAEVIDEAVAAGCRFGAFVLDKRHFDPWENGEQWEGHLFATYRLLRGMATRNEVATALMDHISVPQGVSYGDALLSKVNGKLRNKRFTSAISLDSRTCSGLQVADLVASSIYHYRRKVEAGGLEAYLREGTPKARLARHVADALGVGTLDDGVSDLITIKTSHEKSWTEVQNALMLSASGRP